MAAEPQRRKPRRRIVAEFDYCGPGGELLFQTVRYDPKGFSQRRPDGKGGWAWDLKGVDLVPYNLPDLLTADPSVVVQVHEGEKHCKRAEEMGFLATCNPMGAGKWKDEYSEHLRGCDVAIFPDNDEPGRRHAEQVARSVARVARSVRLVVLPGLPEKGDLCDWGGTAADLQRIVAEAPLWVPPVEIEPADDDDSEPIRDDWPTIDEHAFHGIAGDLVWTADPETESDPAATLLQLLVAFGSLIGRGPHFVVGATRHYLNLFLALIGPTAAGRKGSSWDVVLWILADVDAAWSRERIQGGLVSGEGLIYHLRDPVTRTERKKGRHAAVDAEPETVVADEGVEDKRLLIVETELSRTLKAMNRENSTLSDVLRQAWESGNLRTLAKNNPNKATSAHVSVVAHATRHDIIRHLSETDSANGFANRFLWAASRRSKELPGGGDIIGIDWSPIRSRLTRAAGIARDCGRMRRDREAEDLWRGTYPELDAGHPGLLGAVLNRAVPQTMRLACLYALLDGSTVVGSEHLVAALSLWRYCEDSARYIFGNSLGDPDSEKLLTALRSATEGLSRTEISVGVFGRHKKKEAIAKILSELLSAGLIHRREEPRPGGGRPTERWFAGRGNGRAK